MRTPVEEVATVSEVDVALVWRSELVRSGADLESAMHPPSAAQTIQPERCRAFFIV